MDEAVAQLNHILKASCIYGFCTHAHTHRVNKQQKKIGPRLSPEVETQPHTHTQTQWMNCETFNTRPPVYNYGQEKRKKQKKIYIYIQSATKLWKFFSALNIFNKSDN